MTNGRSTDVIKQRSPDRNQEDCAVDTHFGESVMFPGSLPATLSVDQYYHSQYLCHVEGSSSERIAPGAARSIDTPLGTDTVNRDERVASRFQCHASPISVTPFGVHSWLSNLGTLFAFYFGRPFRPHTVPFPEVDSRTEIELGSGQTLPCIR